MRPSLWLLSLGLLLGPLTVAAAQDATPTASATALEAAEASSPQEVALDVSLNGQRQGTCLMLQRGGELWASEDDLQRWRVQRLLGDVRVVDGVRYRPLGAYGVTVVLDGASLSATLTLPAQYFAPSLLGPGALGGVTPQQSGSGVALQYGLRASPGAGGLQWGGAATLRAFGSFGTLSSGLTVAGGAGAVRLTRLNTSYRWSDPASGLDLELGDTLAPAGTWGAAVPLGGVQVSFGSARRFGVDPHPTLNVEGVAERPSTVTVSVDGHPVKVQAVPPGPFRLTDLSVNGASGRARVVLVDDLGARRSWEVPFARFAPLLRPGYSDTSVSVGFGRRGFGVRSFDYGAAQAVATTRLGLSPSTTAEARLEASAGALTFGVTASHAWTGVGLASASLAASWSQAGWGSLAALDLTGASGPVSYSVGGSWRTSAFVQLGRVNPPQLEARASLGVRSTLGDLSLGARWTRAQDGADAAWLSAQVQRSLGGGRSLRAAVSRSLTGPAQTSFSVGLQLPLGSGDAASLAASPAGVQAAFNHSAPRDPLAYGVTVSAQPGGTTGFGRVQWNTPAVTLGADAYLTPTTAGGSLSASGSLGLVDGALLASSADLGSVALVQVGDFAGVRVYLNGRLAGRTDVNGRLAVAGLTSLQANTVSIETRDLPVQAQLGAASQQVAPLPGNSVRVDFAVRRVRAATLNLHLPDGSPVPAGAVGTLEGSLDGEEVPVAAGGFAYLQTTQERANLQVRWSGGRCDAELSLPGADDDDVPDLGAVECRPLP